MNSQGSGNGRRGEFFFRKIACESGFFSERFFIFFFHVFFAMCFFRMFFFRLVFYVLNESRRWRNAIKHKNHRASFNFYSKFPFVCSRMCAVAGTLEISFECVVFSSKFFSSTCGPLRIHADPVRIHFADFAEFNIRGRFPQC